jgi:hypothetical protein
MALHPLSNAVRIIDQLPHQAAYGFGGGGHRILYGRRQPDSFGELGRTASHQIGGRQPSAKVGERGEYGDRVHPMGVELAALDIGCADLQNNELAGRAGSRASVDQHECVVSLKQVVGQVHATYSVVAQPGLQRQRLCLSGDLGLIGHVAYDLRSEPVVTEEDVSDPRDENGRFLLGSLVTTHIFRISTYRLASGMDRTPT